MQNSRPTSNRIGLPSLGRVVLISVILTGGLSISACDKAAAATENPESGAGQESGSAGQGGTDAQGTGDTGTQGGGTAGSEGTTSATRGKELFTSKCGECHDLPVPADHGAAEWPAIVAEMGPKADLTEADSKLVLEYILSVRGA